jgi:hypothetical protein
VLDHLHLSVTSRYRCVEARAEVAAIDEGDSR